jgi:hypothetical protein
MGLTIQHAPLKRPKFDAIATAVIGGSKIVIPANVYAVALIIQPSANSVLSVGYAIGTQELEADAAIEATEMHTVNIGRTFKNDTQIFISGLIDADATFTLITINV